MDTIMKKIYGALICCTCFIVLGYKLYITAQDKFIFDPADVKAIQDDTFNMYSVPQIPAQVDFDHDIIKWGGRTYYQSREERENHHYIYADITRYMEKNEYSPTLLRGITEEQIFKNTTDYVTGYIGATAPAGIGISQEASMYPVPLDDKATHIISLTTHRRVDRNGNFEGFYGGSKANFLSRMFVLLEAGTRKKIGLDLMNAIFDLSAQRPVGLRADQENVPNAPLPETKRF